jgi:hypothetical protein
VQGLELDWACGNWDADLRFGGAGWYYHDFRGSKWQTVKDGERRNCLRNAYRVLLTRARQGMVLFVPPGDEGDRTRAPEFYDSTFCRYIVQSGDECPGCSRLWRHSAAAGQPAGLLAEIGGLMGV